MTPYAEIIQSELQIKHMTSLTRIRDIFMKLLGIQWGSLHHLPNSWWDWWERRGLRVAIDPFYPFVVARKGQHRESEERRLTLKGTKPIFNYKLVPSFVFTSRWGTRSSGSIVSRDPFARQAGVCRAPLRAREENEKRRAVSWEQGQHQRCKQVYRTRARRTVMPALTLNGIRYAYLSCR